MKQYILFLTVLFFSLNSYSQEILNTHSVLLKSKGEAYQNVFPLVNETTSETALLIGNKNSFIAYLYNPDFIITDSISFKKPADKFSIIGGIIHNDNYSIYSSTPNYSEIHSETFNFKTKQTSSVIVKLSLKRETVLQSFTQNNQLYLLSLLKKKNQMKLYIFNETGRYTEHLLDFSSFTFFSSKSKTITLDKIFTTGIDPDLSIEKIDMQSPSSLSSASKTRKMYLEDHQLILTFDHLLNFTQTFIIDLNSYTVTEKLFSQPKLQSDTENNSVKSNSFFYKQKLYLLKSDKENMAFSVKDFGDKGVIKEYHINKTDSINFRNSNIIQEDGLSSSNLNSQTTGQFLKNITALNVALSVYETPQDIIVTIGGIQQNTGSYSGGRTVSIGFGFGISNSGSGVGVFIGPNFQSISNNYNNYSNGKSVYFDCLFDQDMNHKPFEVEPIAFDKIDQFYKTYQHQTSTQTVFKYSDHFIIGYYDITDEKYMLRKFMD